MLNCIEYFCNAIQILNTFQNETKNNSNKHFDFVNNQTGSNIREKANENSILISLFKAE